MSRTRLTSPKAVAATDTRPPKVQDARSHARSPALIAVEGGSELDDVGEERPYRHSTVSTTAAMPGQGNAPTPAATRAAQATGAPRFQGARCEGSGRIDARHRKCIDREEDD